MGKKKHIGTAGGRHIVAWIKGEWTLIRVFPRIVTIFTSKRYQSVHHGGGLPWRRALRCSRLCTFWLHDRPVERKIHTFLPASPESFLIESPRHDQLCETFEILETKPWRPEDAPFLKYEACIHMTRIVKNEKSREKKEVGNSSIKRGHLIKSLQPSNEVHGHKAVIIKTLNLLAKFYDSLIAINLASGKTF